MKANRHLVYTFAAPLVVLALVGVSACGSDGDEAIATDAPPATDVATRPAFVADDLRVRQVHDRVSLPPELFELFPDALSGIVVVGDLPEGCRMIAVHDANGDGVLGDDVTVDGTQITVGGATFDTVGLGPDGSMPASYDVDVVPENEVMTAS